MGLRENPELLTLAVAAALTGALLLYAMSWAAAWRHRRGRFLGWWFCGSALVIFAGFAPFILGIRFGSGGPSLGALEMAARLFLVVTTMGAFIPLALISGTALLLGGLIFLISRAST